MSVMSPQVNAQHDACLPASTGYGLRFAGIFANVRPDLPQAMVVTPSICSRADRRQQMPVQAVEPTCARTRLPLSGQPRTAA